MFMDNKFTRIVSGGASTSSTTKSMTATTKSSTTTRGSSSISTEDVLLKSRLSEDESNDSAFTDNGKSCGHIYFYFFRFLNHLIV